MKTAGQKLGVPVHLYDIDTDDVKKADELVKKYGDWSPDYVIPQVFVELKDGGIKHVLTGYSEGVSSTKRAVENLLKSDLFKGRRRIRKRKSCCCSCRPRTGRPLC